MSHSFEGPRIQRVAQCHSMPATECINSGTGVRRAPAEEIGTPVGCLVWIDCRSADIFVEGTNYIEWLDVLELCEKLTYDR